MNKLIAALGMLIMPGLTLAQGFSAMVTPPRVELRIKPGQGTRQVLEITQVALQPGRFRIYTNDWQMNAEGGAQFFDELQPGSCRPWVALERREITVQGGNKARFRFEVSPPADARTMECRFAIMVEGLDTSTVSPGGLSFPVSGRIAVVVYAGMDGTKPDLKVINLSVKDKLPSLTIRNDGNAHGRLTGSLSGVDASGKRIDFSPNTLPIMNGDTRDVQLLINPDPSAAQNAPLPEIQYPITIKGKLEWGGKSEPFESTFRSP